MERGVAKPHAAARYPQMDTASLSGSEHATLCAKRDLSIPSCPREIRTTNGSRSELSVLPSCLPLELKNGDAKRAKQVTARACKQRHSIFPLSSSLHLLPPLLLFFCYLCIARPVSYGVLEACCIVISYPLSVQICWCPIAVAELPALSFPAADSGATPHRHSTTLRYRNAQLMLIFPTCCKRCHELAKWKTAQKEHQPRASKDLCPAINLLRQ